MPRGHLKSSVVTVGLTLQQIAKDPKVRILIVSATYDMAVNFVGQIQKILQRNKKFKDLFGIMDKNSSQWRQDRFTVAAADEEVIEGISYEKKEPTVTAMGVGGNLVSTHFDLIILDDVVNRDNVSTKEQIDKVITFYKDVLDLRDSDATRFIVIGTRWHDADLYGWLMDPKNPESNQVEVYIRQAVSNPRIVREGFNYQIQGDDILFPQKFSIESLQSLLDSKGPYEFAAQYLNRMTDDESATFRKSWFRYYDPDDLKGRILNTYVMVDPAISQNEDADYTAMVVVSMDEFSKVFVREIVRERLTPIEIIDRLFLLDERWRPRSVGIESVAFQKSLQYYINEECRKRGHYLPMTEIRPESQESKEQRIRGLQPYYARGDVFHPTHVPNIDYFEDELLRFPRGKNDDTIDALAYFPQLAFTPKKKKERESSHHYLY
jgi:predicted phage terminase large subunit-like protein